MAGVTCSPNRRAPLSTPDARVGPVVTDARAEFSVAKSYKQNAAPGGLLISLRVQPFRVERRDVNAMSNQGRASALVAVVFRLVRTVYRYAKVIGLSLRKTSQLHAQLIEVESGHLFVELLGKCVNLALLVLHA